jgi:hypothetical protein
MNDVTEQTFEDPEIDGVPLHVYVELLAGILDIDDDAVETLCRHFSKPIRRGGMRQLNRQNELVGNGGA